METKKKIEIKDRKNARLVVKLRKNIFQIARKRFGKIEAEGLDDILNQIDDPDLINSIFVWVQECHSAAELKNRIQTALGKLK